MFLSDKLEADLRGLVADWRALAQAKLAEAKAIQATHKTYQGLCDALTPVLDLLMKQAQGGRS